MRKRLLMIVLGLVSLIFLTSCGASELKEEQEKLPTKTPSEVAQLYIDAIIGKGDAPLVEYNSILEDFATNVEDYKQISADYMLDGLSEDGATPENINLLKESILGRNNTVEITVVGEEVKGDTATVTLSIKGLNLNGMDANIDERIQNDLNIGVLNYNMDDAALMNFIIVYMSDYTKTAPLFEEGTPVVLDFRLVNDLWVMNESNYRKTVDTFINIPEVV